MFVIQALVVVISLKVLTGIEVAKCGEVSGSECLNIEDFNIDGFNVEGFSEGVSRVAGGVSTDSHERPFQAALYTYLGSSVGFCGGALISPDYVLTAAHCCYQHGQDVDRILVILGAHSLYDRYENGRRSVDVEEVVVHPGWDPESFADDLALLRIEHTAQVTDTIEPVLLPYLNISSFNFAGMAGTVSGWGIAGEGVTFIAPTLRKKIMTVMTNDLCNSFHFNTLPSNIICGYYQAAGTCKGDNGGPMTIFYSATNETVLVGIATFIQESGCNTNLPSVFTRVQNYLSWISDVSGVELQ